jgi:hypothetical protein
MAPTKRRGTAEFICFARLFRSKGIGCVTFSFSDATPRPQHHTEASEFCMPRNPRVKLMLAVKQMPVLGT